MSFKKTLGLGMFVGLITVSCTRKAETQLLNLSLQLGTGGQGAQTLSGNISFAVVNVQLPTGPLVKKFEFDTPVAAGQKLTVEIPNVPKGSFLVQFLGVFETDGQASVFAYDDEYATVSGATSEVTLNAASIGSFTREGRVAGRYLTSNSPDAGPTGNMVMQFQPPGNVPPMSIETYSIVDGWFNIMVLDGAAMNFVMENTQETVFSQVQMSGGNLLIGGSTMATGTELAQFSTPATFKAENEGSGVFARAMAPADIFVGFIAKAPANTTGKKVCYPNNINEGTRYFSDSSLSSRVDVITTGLVTSAISRIAGGTGATQMQLYNGSATGCYSGGAGTYIVAYHTTLHPDGYGAAGLQPPFKAVKPFQTWDSYIRTKLLNGPTRIAMSWEYLPGAASFDGVAILAKNSSNGGGGGQQSCSDLLAEGYVEVTSVGSGTTSYDFTGTATTPLTTGPSGNYSNWRFALCAYQGSGATRQYLGSYVTGGNVMGANGSHFGWAPSTATANPAAGTYTSLGGGQERLRDVSTASSFYTLLTIDNTIASISPGDEVMALVVGRGGTTGSCGYHLGQPIEVGQHGFARVISNSGSSIMIEKDTFFDSFEGQATQLQDNTADAGTDFCRVIVYKVLQFRNLDLSAASALSGGGAPFDYGSNFGSVLPLRVNNLLSLGPTTKITVNDGGYEGGYAGGSYYGGGVRGAVTTSSSTETGGAGHSAGGAGGGGYGSGGNGNSNSGGANGGSGYTSGGGNSARLVFGSGGGSTLSNSGGKGGGIIFIAAKKILLAAGNPTLEAKGETSANSGGGGGGSIHVVVNDLQRVSTETIALMAGGGSALTASAGVGGGGSASALVCSTNLSGGDYSATASVGGGGGVTAGSGTGSTSFQVDPSSWLCSGE